MARPKSKDPVAPVTITLPRSVRRTAQEHADAIHLSLSGFIAKVIREFFQQIEKGMR